MEDVDHWGCDHFSDLVTCLFSRSASGSELGYEMTRFQGSGLGGLRGRVSSGVAATL